MMKRSTLLPLLLAAFVAIPAVVPAAEIDERVEEEARALFTQIMSPYCPGSLLNECPSSQAAILREQIRDKLKAGVTRDQIKAELIATYGDDVLASPPFTGVGVLSWLGAVAIFLGGLGAVGAWLRGRKTPVQNTPAAPVADDELRQRMKQELAADDEI